MEIICPFLQLITKSFLKALLWITQLHGKHSAHFLLSNKCCWRLLRFFFPTLHVYLQRRLTFKLTDLRPSLTLAAYKTFFFPRSARCGSYFFFFSRATEQRDERPGTKTEPRCSGGEAAGRETTQAESCDEKMDVREGQTSQSFYFFSKIWYFQHKQALP